MDKYIIITLLKIVFCEKCISGERCDSWTFLTSHARYDKIYYICSNATVHRGGTFGHTTQPEVVSDIQCQGTEADVSNCTVTYSERPCSPGEEVGVSCGEFYGFNFLKLCFNFFTKLMFSIQMDNLHRTFSL